MDCVGDGLLECLGFEWAANSGDGDHLDNVVSGSSWQSVSRCST